jgi:hypothetical protein
MVQVVLILYQEITEKIKIRFRFMVFDSNSTIFQLYHGTYIIGGGNWSIRRKPQTCRKSLTNFIT